MSPEEQPHARSAEERSGVPPARWPTREEASQSLLYSPLSVGQMQLAERTWVPAMVPWRATAEGAVTPAVLQWYGRFAEGQPGAIVVEATGIRDINSGPLLRAGHQRFLPGLRELVRVVRERSGGRTRVLIQLIDFLTIRRRPPVDKYVRRFLELREVHRERLEQVPGSADAARGPEPELREHLLALPHETLLSLLDEREVEDLERGYRERVTDTQLEHIRELPRVLPALFASASERARDAGFDGVELHFAHAYTMASFLSPTNTRDDGYGGSREGRLRLPLEVYERTREAVGSDYPLGCRFLGDEVVAGGGRVEDAAHFGERFAAAGMDFLSISKGGKFDDARQPRVGAAVYPYTGESGHECMPTVRISGGPFGRNLPLSSAVRAGVRAAGHRTPVVGAGGINSFELAEAALRAGDCDIVGAARQSLADPDWFRKVRLGRGAEVRRCLYTNYCEGLDQRHLEVTCQLWDRDLAEGDAGASEDATVQLTADRRRRLAAPGWREAP